MPLLVWDEADFTACLETLPTIDEYETGYHYVVQKDGLRLDLSVFPFSADVCITVYRENVVRPIIDFRITDGVVEYIRPVDECTHVLSQQVVENCELFDNAITDCSGTKYVRDERGEFLEFAPSQVFGDRFHADYVIPVGVQLSVKPSICISMFAK